jgi:hypothetical protein
MDQLHKQYLCHTTNAKPKSSNTKVNDDDSTKTHTNTFDLSDNIKLTTECYDSEDGLAIGGAASNKLSLKECDRNKLCPLVKNLSRMSSKERNETAATSRQDSDEWLTDDEDGSMSDSGTTTASSCSSNATPKSSPKKSPLLANKVKATN